MVASKEGRWLGTSQAIGDCSNLRGVTMHLRLLVRPHPSLSLIEERGKATLKEEDARHQRVKCSFKKRRANRIDRAMGGSPFVDRMRTRKRNGVAVAKRDAHTGARKRSKCMFWFGWGGG
ncbi:hypothetical protein GW17_00045396 [Ensete ventricosum]|nr:hypothetical protein GW17_00045396 [Ensete ventricosum]